MQDDAVMLRATAAARARWHDAGVELEEQPMTPTVLASSLQKSLARARIARGRYAPTSFSPDDSTLTIFPRAEPWRWESMEWVLSQHAGNGLMVRLPLFWQVEIPLFEACKASGVYIFINDKGNMPLGAAALVRASVAVVVTDAQDANDFATYLMLSGHPFPPMWLIIQEAHSLIPLCPALTGSTSSIAQEIHILPGVPVLAQCEHTAGKEFSFHAVEGYVWEHGTRVLITGHSEDPLPLVRYDTGLATEKAGSCTCGKEIVRVRTVQRPPTTAS